MDGCEGQHRWRQHGPRPAWMQHCQGSFGIVLCPPPILNQGVVKLGGAKRKQATKSFNFDVRDARQVMPSPFTLPSKISCSPFLSLSLPSLDMNYWVVESPHQWAAANASKGRAALDERSRFEARRRQGLSNHDSSKPCFRVLGESSMTAALQ
jgi:hypothetical protein